MHNFVLTQPGPWAPPHRHTPLFTQASPCLLCSSPSCACLGPRPQPVLPPNLKRLRTSAVDKLKQSGAPGEDLSTFIPTPTWGSPRVSELQPAALAGNKPGGARQAGGPPSSLAAKAAHAASLLAQAAANSAARSSSMPAALGGGVPNVQEPHANAAAAGTSDRGPPAAAVQQAGTGREGAPGASADSGVPGRRLVRRNSGQLASLLQRQRSGDELVRTHPEPSASSHHPVLPLLPVVHARKKLRAATVLGYRPQQQPSQQPYEAGFWLHAVCCCLLL